MQNEATIAGAIGKPKAGVSDSFERSAMPIPAPPPTEMTAADMTDVVNKKTWIKVDTLVCRDCGGPAFRHPAGNLLFGCPAATCKFTVTAFMVERKFKDAKYA